ncbi:MAG: type II CAAX prenyl endopeptidase Rce1 family protein [Deltaproteobacteria bacterium]
MNKVKVTQANKLLFVVVFLLAILPQILFPVLENLFNFEFSQLAASNEIVKISLLLIDQYVFILIPIIVFTIINKLNIKEVFRLKPINFSAGLLTVIMAAAAWFVSAFTSIIVYHIYTIVIGKPGNVMDNMIPANMYLGLFLIALTPAICEEALFRGIVLKAYENRGTVKAIVITAILFALIHFSIIRVTGPFIIALLAGYLVVKSNSIIPGILTHFTFNGISLCIFYAAKTMPEQPERLPGMPEYLIMSMLVAFALMVIAICLIGFNYVTSFRENALRKGRTYRFFLGGAQQENQAFKKSIASVKNDLISILSNWSIVIILLVFVFFNIIEILSILYE